MAARGERRRRGRLSRSGDFDRVYREGNSHSNRFLVLYAFPRSPEEAEGNTRLGVSVSRKVGGSVQRSGVKRALREAFWALAEDGALPPAHDFVLVARPAVAEVVARDGANGVAAALREVVASAGMTPGRRNT